jgi:hypothetical protein
MVTIRMVSGLCTTLSAPLRSRAPRTAPRRWASGSRTGRRKESSSRILLGRPGKYVERRSFINTNSNSICSIFQKRMMGSECPYYLASPLPPCEPWRTPKYCSQDPSPSRYRLPYGDRLVLLEGERSIAVGVGVHDGLADVLATFAEAGLIRSRRAEELDREVPVRCGVDAALYGRRRA